MDKFFNIRFFIIDWGSYQHCRPQVEFVEELRYENVNFQHICNVFFLHIPKNVYEPFKVLVGRTNPQEVNLKQQMLAQPKAALYLRRFSELPS